jgi:hypothetical protein
VIEDVEELASEAKMHPLREMKFTLAELLPIMISVVVKVVQQILKARFSINTGETFASRRIGGYAEFRTCHLTWKETQQVHAPSAFLYRF